MKNLKQVQKVVGNNFAVKWEDSPEFMEYIEWLNKQSVVKFAGDVEDTYYGIIKSEVNCHYFDQIGDAKTLTAAEIMAIIKERSVEDIEREIADLQKELEAKRAEEPLELKWSDLYEQYMVGKFDDAIALTKVDFHFAKKGHALGINTKDFDVKEHETNGFRYLTFHKKVK